MVVVKIKKYKVARDGARGMKIPIPPMWAEGYGVKAGDHIEVYQDAAGRLIIVKEGHPMGDDATELSRVRAGSTQIDPAAFRGAV